MTDNTVVSGSPPGLHNRLAVLRAERALTRRQLAEAVGINPQTVGFLERGDHGPSVELALRLAAHFHLPVEALFSPTPLPATSARLRTQGYANLQQQRQRPLPTWLAGQPRRRALAVAVPAAVLAVGLIAALTARSLSWVFMILAPFLGLAGTGGLFVADGWCHLTLASFTVLTLPAAALTWRWQAPTDEQDQ